MKWVVFSSLFFGALAFANNPGVSYQGRIFKPDGSALEAANVQFRMQVRSPGSENCLLYEEIQTINMAGSAGVFSITINDGSGTRLDTPTYQVDRIFANRGVMTLDATRCSVGTVYTPNVADGRKFIVYFKDPTMGAFEPLPIMSLNYVPQSMYALEAQKLDVFAATNILRAVDGTGAPAAAPAFDPTQLANLNNLIAGTSTQYATTANFNSVQTFAKTSLPTCAAGEVLKSNGSVLSCVTDATSVGASGGTVTDVTSANSYLTIATSTTTPALTLNVGTTANTVAAGNDSRITGALQSGTAAGGSLAGNYPNPTIAASAITNAEISNTAAIADSKLATISTAGKVSGSAITSGTIGGSTVISTSGNIQTTAALKLYDGGPTNSVGLKAPTTIATSFDLILPATKPAVSGYLLSSDTSGVLSWVAPGGGGTVTSVTASAPLASSGGSTPNITLSQATTTTAGYLSSADWNTFNSKLGSTLASANILVGNNTNVATAVSPGGDVTMNNAGSFTVTKVQGTAVSATLPSTAGQVLRYTGSQWAPNFLSMFDLRSTITGATSFAAGCTAGQTLTWTAATDNLACTSIAINDSQISNTVSRTANTFLAAPNGSAGAATYRAIASADLPNITLSSLTAASGSNGINNANFAQTWNWNSATTENPMTFTSNALTSGSLLSLTTSSASLNSTNGLLNVANSSASTAGILARFQANSTAGSGMTILNSGNVGVGTASPASMLDLNGDFIQRGMAAPSVAPAGQGRIYFDSTVNKFKVSQNSAAFIDLVGGYLSTSALSSTVQAYGVCSAGNELTLAGIAAGGICINNPYVYPGGNTTLATLKIGTKNSQALQLITNNTTAVSIDTSGNVGIGTSTPTYLLQVAKTSAGSEMLIGDAIDGSTADANTRVEIGNGAANSVLKLGQGSANALSMAWNYNATASNAYASIGTIGGSNPLILQNGGGNVGIATTAPVSKLHVGSAPTASTNYGLVSLGSGAFDGLTNGFFVGSSNGTVEAINAASGFAGNLVDYQVAGVSKFKVDSSGNVTSAGTSNLTGNTTTSGNFTQTGSSTFSTGTGAVSFNGDATLAAGKNLSLSSGTGTFTQTYTGTATAATLTANSVTTASAESITANGLTSGSILSLSSNSTTAAAGNTGLNISISGTNATSAITRTGISSSVTATGTSSTNVAASFSASGGTNNYGLLVPNGSVGIGTTSPSRRLEIVESAYVGAFAARGAGSNEAGYVGSIVNTGSGYTGALELRNGSTASAVGVDVFLTGANNTGWAFGGYNSSANGYNLYIAGSSKNYFAGNVGIGTITPTAMLDVSSGSGSGILLGADVSATTRTDNTTKIGRIAAPHYNNASTPMAVIMGSSSLLNNDLFVGGGSAVLNAATQIGFFTAANRNTLAGTERMRIDTNGNVGIGTTNPAGVLDVAGGVASAATSGTNIRFVAQDAGAGNKNGGNIVATGGAATGSGSAGSFLVGASSVPYATLPRNSIYAAGDIVANGNLISTYSLLFGDGSTGISGSNSPNFISLFTSSSEKVRVDSSGNVGIGTTSPAVSLDLSGKTDSLRMPAGTTAQRPGTPANGDIRVNSTNGTIEAYLSSAWMDLTNAIMKRANITTTPYSITNTLGGYYMSYNNAAAGTINLPALSGVADGWSVTILRKVAQSVTLTPNGADTFDNGLTTLEMRSQNIKSVTLMNNGGVWSITNKTDDCVVGKSCWGTGNVYLGIYNGMQMFTTPGGCTDSTTPTCAGGTDTVTKAWAASAPETNTLLGFSNETDGASQSASLAVYATANAAQFCENMTYAGYTDWYLPSRQELNFLYQNAPNVGGFVYSLYYWSSTEATSTTAWRFYVYNGYINSINKTNAYYVRCVRRF